MSIAQVPDKRIDEILELAREERLPLALSPQTICALEDNGWLADPFTGQLWPDWMPTATANVASLGVTWSVLSDLTAEIEMTQSPISNRQEHGRL